MRRKMPHTATYKGHKVKVTLWTGETFIDRFINRTKNKRVIFENRIVRSGDIKSFVPYHAENHGNHERKI